MIRRFNYTGRISIPRRSIRIRLREQGGRLLFDADLSGLKEYADIIAKEVERLETILNEILGFVKEARIMKETVNAGRILEEVIAPMQAEIEDKGVVLVKESGEPIDIYVDPNRMKDALLNILRNSVQAVDAGGTVTVKTYRKDGECVFEIADTGPGISEADKPYIFDPFFTTKKSGTGLGLTITHRIIEEHAGRIDVRTEPGKGSTFSVFMPLKK